MKLAKMRARYSRQAIAPPRLASPFPEGFDTVAYPCREWCRLNVMMVDWEDGIALRRAIGQIHEDALLESPVQQRTVLLG